MNWEAKYQLLSKCENELICSICRNFCESPKILRGCGHYFCENCISQKDNCCPKCKEVFFSEDVDSNNNFDELIQNVEYFKRLLDILSKNVKVVDTKEVAKTKKSLHIPLQVYFTDPKFFRKNAKGESKLHLACKRKRIEEAIDLLKENVDINSKDYAGWTPLHEAVQAESIEIVSELLSNNVLINSPGEDYTTPLHKAVLIENISIIHVLVKNGADTEAIDFHGRKPADLTKNQNLLDALKIEPEKSIAIPKIFLPNKVVAYCHSIDEEYRNKLSSAENVQVIHEFNIEKQTLTHLVVKKSHKISFKILLSLLNGLIIVRQEWIDDFLRGTMDLPLDTVLENEPKLNEAIRRALINKLMNKPKLFDGIKFYLEGIDNEIKIYRLKVNRDILRLLISVGGGINLSRAPAPRTLGHSKNFPYHASSKSSVFGCTNIIIFDDQHPPKLQYKIKELQHKSCKWLFDCILDFKLI